MGITDFLEFLAQWGPCSFFVDCNGNGIPDECEPPANDKCEDAIAISDGATSFRTVGATAVGPPALCENFTSLANDIWYRYTATCTGIATFSLCNDVNFDSRLVVYFAGACPPSVNPLVCSGDGILTVSCEP